MALADEADLAPQLGRVIASRAGAVPGADKQRRLVVEFAGGDLPTLEPEQPVTSNVSLKGGKVVRTYVEALPSQKTWRLFIDLQPEQGKAADIRAFLVLRGKTLTETFSDLVPP